jgi:hypothetical protein
MISDHIKCPRCGAEIGVECRQRDPEDTSDVGQHSARIHAFLEEGSLAARTEVHLETKEAMARLGFSTGGQSLFLTQDELLDRGVGDDYNCRESDGATEKEIENA